MALCHGSAADALHRVSRLARGGPHDAQAARAAQHEHTPINGWQIDGDLHPVPLCLVVSEAWRRAHAWWTGAAGVSGRQAAPGAASKATRPPE